MADFAPASALVNPPGFMDNGLGIPAREAGAMIESQANEELADLIRLGAEGDERALERIYNRFKRPLFSLACRYTGNASTAEDILQEVFLKAFTRLHEVRNAATFPAWLYKIAVNASLSHLRATRHERREAVPIAELEGVLAAPSEGEEQSGLRRPLEEAIRNLPGRLKAVFLLHDVQGFKHEEISAMLGLATGTTKSHLFKARLKLRKYLIKSGALIKKSDKE